jgi:hypothetical protein
MRWISLNPKFRGYANVMRDGTKSRFVALFSARMMASAINSENCCRGSSCPPIGAVAAGGIGLVLSRKFWQRHKVAHQSDPELVPGDTSIAAAPM